MERDYAFGDEVVDLNSSAYFTTQEFFQSEEDEGLSDVVDDDDDVSPLVMNVLYLDLNVLLIFSPVNSGLLRFISLICTFSYYPSTHLDIYIYMYLYAHPVFPGQAVSTLA